MKKLGFTLSELLVALGIIAVGATFIAPTMTSIIPDKNKIKVINYYNKINEINQKLLNSPNLYYPEYYNNLELKCSGFASFKKPLEIKNDNQDIDNKYSNLFFAMLNGTNISQINFASKPKKFEMSDGSTIEITTDKRITQTIPYTFKAIFELDIDSNNKEEESCSYDANNCKKPDTFKFKVDESGNVTAGDPMTDAYLTTIGKSNSQKEDKELAKKYSKERIYD